MAGIMCVVAGWMVSLSAPNGSINKKYTFLRVILLVLVGFMSAPCQFHVGSMGNFGSFWDHFGALWVHFGVVFGTHWATLGPL